MGSFVYSNLARPALSEHSPENRAQAAFEDTRLDPHGYVPCAEAERLVPGRVARAILAARRRRDALFPSDLFADAAWDMLLELYASHLEQQRISVTQLCSCSAVPLTTALRWVSRLEQEGLVAREHDPVDARRSWIELTPAGLTAMRRYFEMLPFGSLSI